MFTEGETSSPQNVIQKIQIDKGGFENQNRIRKRPPASLLSIQDSRRDDHYVVLRPILLSNSKRLWEEAGRDYVEILPTLCQIKQSINQHKLRYLF